MLEDPDIIARSDFDDDLRHYLKQVMMRPSMYVGPKSVQTLEIVLLNLFNVRACVFRLDRDPRETLRKTYLKRFGHSAGAGGPASKLVERFENDPCHDEVIAFYEQFIEEAFK